MNENYTPLTWIKSWFKWDPVLASKYSRIIFSVLAFLVVIGIAALIGATIGQAIGSNFFTFWIAFCFGYFAPVASIWTWEQLEPK
jgi:hypothetical protein